MNFASWVMTFIVLAIAALVIRNMIREKQSGSCGCGCSSCGGACPHCLTPAEKGDKG